MSDKMRLPEISPFQRTRRRAIATFCACLGCCLLGQQVHAEEIVVRNGLVKIIQQAQVPAREAGALVEVMVREGDQVRRGQILGRLDDQRQRLELHRADLELQVSKHEAEHKGLVNLAANMLERKQQAALEHDFLKRIARQQAENQFKVEANRKQLEVAKNELERALKARDGFANSVSESEVDARRLAVSHADLSFKQAEFERGIDGLKADAEEQATATIQLEIAGARIDLENAGHQRRMAELGVGLRENAVRTAQDNLERRSLVAPLAGIVVEIQRQPGEWMEPGETLVRIINLDRLRVEGFIAAAQAGKVAPGAPARIPLGEEGRLEGVITFISPEIDPVNQEVRIWAEFENSEHHRLLPGMRPTLTVGAR